MAHTVRADSTRPDLRVVRPDDPAPTLAPADELCIDLRDGDLSDEAVVSMLLQLARDRAAELDDVDEVNVLGAAAKAPAHPTTYLEHEPRRRWWPAAVAVGVGLVVAALVVVGLRPPQEVAAPVSTSAPPMSVASAPPADDAPERASDAVATVTPLTTAERTEAQRTTAFCAAVGTYTLDDLPTLAVNGVRDPRGTIDAYAAMVANAPASIADDVTALGPITGKVQSEIESGVITTPEQMQQYLVGGAPPEEIARWIAAQQAIVAELPAICPGRVTPGA